MHAVQIEFNRKVDSAAVSGITSQSEEQLSKLTGGREQNIFNGRFCRRHWFGV